MIKDPLVRVSGEADLILARRKHDILIKQHRHISKKSITDWLIKYAFDFKNVQDAFSEYVKHQSTISKK